MDIVALLIGILVLFVGEVLAASITSVCSIQKSRKENQLVGKEIIRVCAAKTWQIVLFSMMTTFFVGGVVFCIYFIVIKSNGLSVDSIIAIAVVLFLFSIVGILGFLGARFNYSISTDKGIEVHRLFRKTKFYRYEEISVFNHRVSNFSSDTIIGYDKDGKVMFEVGGLTQIGLPAVIERLREKGVRQQMGAPKSSQE